jgi:poly-gamma-glutamate synthesis protein (capsule biosynthesis protein)
MLVRALAALILLTTAPAAAQSLCRPDPALIPPVNACTGRARVSVALVGDVLLHAALQRRGYARGFDTIWGAAVPVLRAADLAIANLEVPTAPGFARGGRRRADPGPVFDGQVHTDYPAFNAHPVVIDALAQAGIDAVTVANNHALDRGPAGLDATLAELARRGMPATGAVPGGARRDFAVRLETRLGPLALIGCTYGTNGIPDPRRQVLRCFEDRAELLAAVRLEATRPGAAGVIVLPHWGTEYSHQPTAAQRALARDLAAAGALAVVGAHPHVVQPWEVVDGTRGRVPVVHSLGNFVAAQIELPRATGMLAWLELCPTAAGVAVGAAGHLPMVMDFAQGPVLTVPGPGATGTGAQARALLARLVPGTDLSGALACERPRRARAPDPQVER